MSDSKNLLQTIKEAAIGAVDASKPVNVTFGKVISTSPLRIQVEQKLILGKQQLILSKSVTNHNISVSINTTTENTNLSCESDLTHNHTISGTKNITINNSLKLNDSVILVRLQGGQKYLVVDRVGE